MMNPAKLPLVLPKVPSAREQFNCLLSKTPHVRSEGVGAAGPAHSVQRSAGLHFPIRCGFGIIALLKSGVEDAATRYADVAQSAEHPPCKRAVTSSILVVGSTGKS